MPIEVDPNWWKTLFDEVYLATDARSVCDDEITRLEVDVICQFLPLDPGHTIMDLCGGHGRHCFELHARGFDNCTVLDYSECLIDHAALKAEKREIPLVCIQADARDTGLPSESFDHVMILGNSLGYINLPEADIEILREAYRLLRPGGWLLVDVTDGSIVKNRFNAEVWHEIEDDIVVCRQRELAGDRINAREMVMSKKEGLVRDRTYSMHLYEPDAIELLLEQVGSGNVSVHTGFSNRDSNKDYGFMNHRMIGIGQKR